MWSKVYCSFNCTQLCIQTNVSRSNLIFGISICITKCCILDFNYLWSYFFYTYKHRGFKIFPTNSITFFCLLFFTFTTLQSSKHFFFLRTLETISRYYIKLCSQVFHLSWSDNLCPPYIAYHPRVILGWHVYPLEDHCLRLWTWNFKIYV